MSGEAVPDSEEDDSDYVQDEAAGDDEEEDEVEEPEDTMGVATSDRQRSKIDDIWASMNASGADATAPPAGGSGIRLAEGKGKKATKKKKKANKKANKVLAGIFGKKAASDIVSGAGKGKRRAGAGAGEGAARKKLLAASRKVEVTEVKKYAGKDIVVKRKVTAGSAEHVAAAGAKKHGGLDNVLAALDGPKSISTVTKSSMDWETYKAAEGIEGDMEQATKDGKGYLNKQDFLQRCDVRKFETELEARQSKRDA
ncbi:unnamed protein product [Ectocarpus sp. 12 AP-2014]